MEKLSLFSRAKKAWNVFLNKDPTKDYFNYGGSFSYRPDRVRLTRGNERTMVTSVYNRISMDCAAIDIRHVKQDEDGRYLETIDSDLNNCLTVEANLDQTARSFKQDIVLSMFDEGCVAIVPVDTIDSPDLTESYKIITMRTGKIVQWYPYHIRVSLYNERTGQREEITIPKRNAAIVENPLYAVINEPNSTMQRLIRKLSLLDAVDEQSSAGKLDLIIQLPYIIKTEARRKQAEQRRSDIVKQLEGSKYGIAYTDGTEHITQLNRPVENNLMKQIEYLTSMLYSQLGITQEILDGTANEATMLNYYTRTIEPIVSAIADEMKRKFLSKTARSQHQSIEFFRDPFSLVPVSQIAEITDKMTRNEVMTSNEIRQIIGMRPSNDPKADQLHNSNINQSAEETVTEEQVAEDLQNDDEDQLAQLDDFDQQLDELEEELNHDALQHYASEYYDPVKAHEYYETHKKLKGRTSTSGLNEKGREAAKYIKDQINSERKEKINANNEKGKSSLQAVRDNQKSQSEQLREKAKEVRERHNQKMQNAINSISSKIKMAVKNEDPVLRNQLREQIERIRKQNDMDREALSKRVDAKRQNLSNRASAQSTNIRSRTKSTNEKIKKDYDDKYASELEKLKSNSEFTNKKRR